MERVWKLLRCYERFALTKCIAQGTNPSAGQVCDNVLREPGQPDPVLYNRAKAMLLIGAIFKSTQPDESDEERRELERSVLHIAALSECTQLVRTDSTANRMVAEAAKPKKKEKGSKFKAPGLHVKHDADTKPTDAPAAEPQATTSG